MPFPLLAALPYLAAAGGGALAGGLAAGGPKSITGTPGQLKQLPTVNPQQQNIIGQAGQGGLGLLQQLLGQTNNFDPIAEQARNQFHTQTVPSIAERFTSMGSGGSQNSSAFRGALGAAGAGLEGNLAALRSQYGLQERGLNQSLLGQLLGVGLTPTMQHYYQPGQGGALVPLLQSLASLGSSAVGLGSGFGFGGGQNQGNQLGGGTQFTPPQAQPMYGGGMDPRLLSPNLLALTQPYSSALQQSQYNFGRGY